MSETMTASERLLKGREEYMLNTTIEIDQLRDIIVDMVERKEITWSEIGRRMGWVRKGTGPRRGYGDNSRVKRALGLKLDKSGVNGRIYRKRIGFELAERFCTELEIDPVEIGL